MNIARLLAALYHWRSGRKPTNDVVNPGYYVRRLGDYVLRRLLSEYGIRKDGMGRHEIRLIKTTAEGIEIWVGSHAPYNAFDRAVP